MRRRFARKFMIGTTLMLALAGCGQHSVMTTSFSVDEKLTAAAMADPCLALTKSYFDQWVADQNSWYKKKGLPVPSLLSQSHLHIGTNGRTIVLIHGFLSSPQSMLDIGNVLAAEGYTLVVPLLTGFASDVDAANSATVDDWNTAIDSSFKVAHACDSSETSLRPTSISLVAHSLGAALTTRKMEEGALLDLDRIILLAPYYKTYSQWTRRLVDHFPFKIDQLNVGTAEAWLDRVGIHLPNFKFTPEGNGRVLPMDAVRTVLDLQNDLAKYDNSRVDEHILPIVSMDDGTIDSSFAVAYVKMHFHEDAPIIYPSGSKVYHSLETRSDNPNFDAMMKAISDYLSK